jgi:hypothetical protein
MGASGVEGGQPLTFSRNSFSCVKTSFGFRFSDYKKFRVEKKPGLSFLGQHEVSCVEKSLGFCFSDYKKFRVEKIAWVFVSRMIRSFACRKKPGFLFLEL